MKTNLLFIVMLALSLSTFQAEAQTTVYAKNSDISDNLDLRAVASIFGESASLQDFERRLNDPEYQISNLDLNNDYDVDYLRVIESVENRTHVIIIQAVLDRDVYQDIATIDVERDNYNKVSVQVVGNTYLYGSNYIYEPVYHATPAIYASFWVNNYRPYYSSWALNYYPTYYYAWRPYPVYRYRNNINVCININNNYNYVNYRRSSRAPILYESRRAYGYEKIRPNYSFSQRNSSVNNRYELDQRRIASKQSNRNNNAYGNSNRVSANRVSANRSSSIENKNYAQNRTSSNRSYNSNPVASNSNRTNSARMNTSARIENSSRTESRRTYNENNMTSSRVNSENKNNSNRAANSQRTESSRNYSENRSSSETRNNSARSQTTQRSEPQRMNQESRGNQGSRENSSSSKSGGRRG